MGGGGGGGYDDGGGGRSYDGGRCDRATAAGEADVALLPAAHELQVRGGVREASAAPVAVLRLLRHSQ
ncbi:hypothetical protein LINPERPRIM_LOCUS8326 [Linum perenne]